MSYTEIHTGRFVKKDIGNITLDDFFKEQLNKESDSTFNEVYYKSPYEQYRRICVDPKYVIVNNCVYEHVSHIEFDSEQSLCNIYQNSDGSFTYITKFYNGGACLDEVIDEDIVSEMERYIRSQK